MSTPTVTKPASPDFVKNLLTRGTNYLSLERMREEFPSLMRSPTEVPALPSEEAVTRLKKANCSLIFIPKDVTAKDLLTVTGNMASDGNDLFYKEDDEDWNEDFFTTETTGPAHLRVFSTEPLPSFGGINYLNQTFVAIEEAARIGVRPEIIAQAKDELESQAEELRHLLTADWVEVARRLINLEANQRFCPNFAQQMMYIVAHERINNNHLICNDWAITKSLGMESRIMAAGNFDDEGIGIDSHVPISFGDSLQRFFSCDVADLAP